MVLPPASLASIDAQSVSLNAWRVFVFALTPAIRYLKAFLEELVGLRLARARAYLSRKRVTPLASRNEAWRLPGSFGPARILPSALNKTACVALSTQGPGTGGVPAGNRS